MKEDFAIIEKDGKEGQDAKMINETKQDHVFYRIVNGMIRLLLAAGGLCMMFPDTLTDLVGLMAMGGACALEYLSAKKGRA